MISISENSKASGWPHPWQESVVIELHDLFSNFFSSLQLPFILDKDIHNEASAAGASNDGSAYHVMLYGGLLKNPRLSEDALRITLCHEMGHHFGGAPRKNSPMDWDVPVHSDGRLLSSSEGQADYYSTATCFRKLVQGQNHDQSLQHQQISPELILQCQQVWGRDTSDSKICIRAGVGSLKLLQLNADFQISFVSPAIERPQKVLRDEFPTRQCRLDTMLAGALCRSSLELQLPSGEGSYQYCENPEGNRPPCWFPEEDPEESFVSS